MNTLPLEVYKEGGWIRKVANGPLPCGQSNILCCKSQLSREEGMPDGHTSSRARTSYLPQ